METNKPKVQLVIKLLPIIVLTLFSIYNTQCQNQDTEVLIAYLNDYKIESGKDTIYLGEKNPNKHILSRIEDYLKFKKDSFVSKRKMISLIHKDKKEFINVQKGDSIYNVFSTRSKVALDPIVHRMFSEDEYENYQKQMVDGSVWEFDSKQLKDVFLSDSLTDKNKTMYVSKPLFTKDGKYAIISHRYYIYFYLKEEDNWKRIHTVSPSDY